MNKKTAIVKTLLVALLLTSCSDSLDPVVKANPELGNVVQALQASEVIYKRCEECRLPGLKDGVLRGYTPRYPPEGRYDLKTVELGKFEYDAYLALESKSQVYTPDQLFFLYFDAAQKQQFEDFRLYHSNLIGHGKLLSQVSYVHTIAVLRISSFDSDIWESFMKPLP